MTAPDLTRGACVGHPDPDLWLSTNPARKEQARRICRTCPVQQECGTAAVRERGPIGIRAGLDEAVLTRLTGKAEGDPTPHDTCGKPSGVRTHRKAGEAPCDACRDAQATYRREARARARERQQDTEHTENTAA